MRTWFLVTKDVLCWQQLAENKEITLTVDQPVRKGDKVLIYKSSPFNHLRYLFNVKNDAYKEKDGYKLHLYHKTKIKRPVKLSELKENNILDSWQKSFRKTFYKVPLCVWGDIIGCVAENNPELFPPFKFVGCSGPKEDGCPINLKPVFFDILKRAKSYKLDSFDEEAAKYRIILPLLQNIGWDIFNLKQVYPEYPVRYKNKKVDYRLTDYSFHETFIEAKMPGVDLDDHECQLIQYCASENVDSGVLTNGICWRFYHLDYHVSELGALKNCSNWDYDEINIKKDEHEEIWNKFLEFFWKEKTCQVGTLTNIPSIKQIFENIKKINDHQKANFNESAVKQVIVLPILAKLGWDIFNEKEFIFNPSVKIKIKKNKKTNERTIRPDYALKNHRKICIEAKRMGVKDLWDHAGHVKAFCEKKRYDLGVATDGQIWYFIIFKDGKYYEEEVLDIRKDSEDKFLNYFQKYLSKEV